MCSIGFGILSPKFEIGSLPTFLSFKIMKSRTCWKCAIDCPAVCNDDDDDGDLHALLSSFLTSQTCISTLLERALSGISEHLISFHFTLSTPKFLETFMSLSLQSAHSFRLNCTLGVQFSTIISLNYPHITPL